MGDRRSFFSRFLPTPASRRPPETKTTSPPPATTNPTPETTPAAAESEPVNHTSETPPKTDTETSERQSTTTGSSPPTPLTQPTSGATKSPSSSKPASPYRRTTPSRSPPQPSSPSSQTPSTPKRTQPRSPSRLVSRSPKQRPSSSQKGTQPTSPSKESKPPTQEISSSYEAPVLPSIEKVPNAAASPQVSQLKSDVESDSANNFNRQTKEGTNFKHDEMELTPSQSSKPGTITTLAQSSETSEQSKISDSSTMNGGHETLDELNPKPEETKDVKEVVQAMNTEANEDTKKEVNEFLTPKSGSEHVPLQKIIKDDMSTFVNQMAVWDPKKAIHNKQVSVITLAGDNRGSLMQMESNASEREKPFYIHRNYKINPDESAEADTDEGRSSEVKNTEDAKSTEDQPKEAYVNNNSQGVNNSIVFNSSIAEGNAGVHMVVTHVPKELIQSREDSCPPETQKAEFNITRSEKHTYEPMVRRRCLRGLFLETSDSDAENPERPRRHGCRVGHEQKG